MTRLDVKQPNLVTAAADVNLSPTADYSANEAVGILGACCFQQGVRGERGARGLTGKPGEKVRRRATGRDTRLRHAEWMNASIGFAKCLRPFNCR